MTAETPQEGPEANTPASPQPSIGEIAQTQRERLFKAMAIIDVCRYGSDSMIGDADDEDDKRPDIVTALGVAYDLLDYAAADLEDLTHLK